MDPCGLVKSRQKSDDWLDVMRQAHRLGMLTTATMMYGHVETAEERSKHLESSWVTRGMKVGQVALGFDPDDMGSVMIEGNVVSVAGSTHRTRTDELVHLIRAQRKIPVQRDTLYREVKVLS